MKTAPDIRAAFKKRYPDVDDEGFSIECSGFVHEHPMTAIATVLISSIMLATTDVSRLATFTGYSERFVSAIAVNMANSRLWKNGEYECGGWSSGNLLPRNLEEDSEFWEHIQIAEGSLFCADVESIFIENASEIFWREKRAN
jgi:hypothetical protein